MSTRFLSGVASDGTEFAAPAAGLTLRTMTGLSDPSPGAACVSHGANAKPNAKATATGTNGHDPTRPGHFKPTGTSVRHWFARRCTTASATTLRVSTSRELTERLGPLCGETGSPTTTPTRLTTATGAHDDQCARRLRRREGRGAARAADHKYMLEIPIFPPPDAALQRDNNGHFCWIAFFRSLFP